MTKVRVLANEVTVNTPPMSPFLKRNVLINYGFPNHSKYKFRRFGMKLRKSRYFMKCIHKR